MTAAHLESNLWKLYLIKAFRWFMLIIPVVVLFWQNNGLDMQEVFWLQSFFSICVILFEIPSGYFSDVIGRKTTLVLGCTLGTAGFGIYSFSYGFWGFLGAEMLLGLGASFISGTDSAILYDTLVDLKKESKYKILEGRMLSAGNFSEGIASIVGGLIAVYSLRLNLVLETVFFACTIPLALTLREPSRHKHQNERGALVEILKIVQYSIITNKQIRWIIAYSAFMGASTLTMVWLTQPFFTSVNLPLGWFGVVWGVFNMSIGVFSIQAHRYESWLGKKRTLISLCILSITAYTLVAGVSSLFILPVFFLFYFIRGISAPLFRDYINQMITSEMRATVLSVKNLAARLVFALVGPLVGWISDAYSLSQAIFSAGCIFLLFNGTALYFIHRAKAW